ncbi:MAG: NADH-quinone oxidoreductase subunit L [Verrucomicrobia bacterium]|nr:MAG: NADH-quinone oxidoreductase subunit L [Verrucomicrobiota bacterium]PYK51896.1 MAG: NADH-quinone oxidoreductase subunit L [Verrucomicrobiota bacterium]PYL41999.1 MAG: NADH-quinone oxidoreductase subunit L [Verrucomicrobiota bacterium]
MNRVIVSNLWLIPAVPFAASLVILSLAKLRRKSAAALAVAGQIAALIMSALAFLTTLQTRGFRAVQNFTWFTFGEQTLRLGFVLDPLAAAMLVMIALVGLCIFVFSVGYMAEDKNFTRFFAYLSFFSGAMLGLVIANSLLLLFIFWELVGLASYLLIGFWIERPSAAAAAKKAFITTRIGDMGFFLGMLWLYNRSSTLLFYDGGSGCLEGAGLAMLGASATFIALLIFCGAVGKSGQFPLHVWLPDAMEGPTPVSALIHAATMVAAGVFLVARVYPLFSLGAINGVTSSLTVVVWIGVTTALMAALIAIAQADIKRILAYSTVSQLGLMMVSLGVGGVAAGIMHLLAHGFFKALLFLGAGSVIHGCHGEHDIRKMGGLRRLMPITFATYAIGMMALSGVPLVFSGGWTKEEILHATAHWPRSHAPYYLILAGVILTALYMTRQMIYVFFGQTRSSSENAHESPRVMTMPLIVLALCGIFFSVVLTPAWPWLHGYLTGEPVHFEIARLIQPMLVVSLALVSAGVGLGFWMYRKAGVQDRNRPAEIDPLEYAQPALFRFLANKMWIDELYGRTVIGFSWMAARLSDWMDRYFWDGLVRGFGAMGQIFGIFTTSVDERGINAGVDKTTAGARGLGRLMSAAHSGQIQTYLGAVAIGMLALLLLYAWLA